MSLAGIHSTVTPQNSDLTELGETYSKSWANSSVGPSGQGSDVLKLPAGTWLISAQTPYCNTSCTMGIWTSSTSFPEQYLAVQTIDTAGLLNMSTIVKTSANETQFWVRNYGSGTLTFQDTGKSYIRAVRVGL